MFDHSITNLPSRVAKREAIESAILAAKEAGTLTYTDIMLNSQELVTFAFEVMDRVILDSNNVPQYGQGGERIDLEPVRLVAIDPEFKIQTSVWHQPRIPGTNKSTRNRVKRMISYGNDVTLEDRLDDERPARRLLWEHGWPIRQFRSRTGELGSIVEWKWFERVATSADATDEYRELYATLKARIGASARPNDKKSAPAGGRPQETRP